MADQNEGKAKPAWVEIILGLIDITKAGFWPALVLGVFISLYGPLHALIARLPEVLGRADVITLGELNIKLNKALAFEASPAVREAVNGLSSNAGRRLIQLTNIYVTCSFPYDRAGFAALKAADHQLEERHLVTISPRPEENKDDKSECYDVGTTDLGKETQTFLVNVLTTTLTLGKE